MFSFLLWLFYTLALCHVKNVNSLDRLLVKDPLAGPGMGKAQLHLARAEPGLDTRPMQCEVRDELE